MNQILAALTFFTRLPFWRLKELPHESYNHLVSYWSLCGWLTGGVMALTVWGAGLVLSQESAVMLALAARLLLTGALHEDGLADFFDGFGGGRDRESTLRIMKDSHIGSYGVLGLIVYYLLAYTLLTALPPVVLPWVLLAGDAWGKFVASNVINLLPYARKEEESKNKVLYVGMSLPELLLSAACGLVPVWWLPTGWQLAILPSLACFGWMVTLFRRRLQGYTGDCCGALFLLCELAFWLGSALCLYCL